jgi:hypothetical protein
VMRRNQRSNSRSCPGRAVRATITVGKSRALILEVYAVERR